MSHISVHSTSAVPSFPVKLMGSRSFVAALVVVLATVRAQSSTTAEVPTAEVPTAAINLSPSGLPCKAYCNASCCHFSEPAKDCSGCDDSIMCAPGKQCYDTGNKESAPPKATEAGECHEWCMETPHCCWFANPKDCEGCDETHGCDRAWP